MSLKGFCWFLPLLWGLSARAADPLEGAALKSPLPYAAPAAGSYRLPVMGSAGDGQVLESNGSATSLSALIKGRVVLLSFIYTSCDDAGGCPMATMVLHQVQAALLKHPALKARVRLVTLSFDPDKDTPAVMARFGESLNAAASDWHFLTTDSKRDLEPILKAYGQSLDAEQTPKGQRFSHALRLFLLDDQGAIRNIYSTSALHPDLVMADLETLLMEASKEVPSASLGVSPHLAAGDDKRHYESLDYETHAAALSQRHGHPQDLLSLARNPGLGLPKVPVPAQQPLTRDKIALGRKLFYDRRLSLNHTISCAMCHIPEQGFTSQEQATAVGLEGRSVRRNAPTLLNAAYWPILFHDGRETALEQQVWGPLLAPNEMGNPSVGTVIGALQHLPDYRGLFEKAFGGQPANMSTVGEALAAYERTLVAGDSPFDRWYFGHEAGAISLEAQRGFALFKGQAGCSGCHLINQRVAFLTDDALHNTGIGYRASMGLGTDQTLVQVAPGVTYLMDPQRLGAVSGAPPSDLGGYEWTQNPKDLWAYRTPSLRNVTLTAPYMHDGSLPTLSSVIDFYQAGGVQHEALDPLIKPLKLTLEERAALISFLETLTSPRVALLVEDAWSAPVGDQGERPPRVKGGQPGTFH